MGHTRMPLQYLLASSENAVEAYSLSCQNRLANVERALVDLFDQWLQAQDAERLSRTILQLRRVNATSESPSPLLPASRTPSPHVATISALPPTSSCAPPAVQPPAPLPLLSPESVFTIDRFQFAVDLGISPEAVESVFLSGLPPNSGAERLRSVRSLHICLPEVANPSPMNSSCIRRSARLARLRTDVRRFPPTDMRLSRGQFARSSAWAPKRLLRACARMPSAKIA